MTAGFETLAGRSAMVGFAMAATAEALLPHSGLFGNWEEARDFALLVSALVALSSVAAAMSTRRMRYKFDLGQRLLEPVLTSLTSRTRSAGAITGRNVDGALDSAMETVFSASFMRRVFPSEADDPYI